MSTPKSSHSWALGLAALAIIASGLALRWPVLYTGFTVDDYAQLAMIHGDYPVARAPLSLFTFSDGSVQENTRLRDVGFFPWWSAPDLRLSLLRPISSALMWFDAYAFGRSAFAYHLHSAFWWIAMMLAIWQFLQRALSRWAAVLAFALFTLHPAHNVLLGWIANRNALVCTAFAVLGLTFQLEAQRRAWRLGYLWAAAAYAVALLAGEYALATLAYGMCLTLLGPSAPARRGRAIAIWGGALFAYVAVRAGLGYGSSGSGMYLDPVHEPIAFVPQALQRYPVLMGDAVLAVRSSWWSGGFPWAGDLADAGWLSQLWAADLRPLRAVQVSLGVAACLVFAVVVWRYVRGRGPARDARCLGFGVPLALVPSLASLPESRLMVPALIGWMALLAQALWDRWHAPSESRAVAAVRCAPLASLVLLAAILPVWSTADELHGLPDFSQAVRKSIATPELDRVLSEGKYALLAAAADPTTSIYVPLVRRWHRRPALASCQLLMGGWGALQLTRINERAFLLERINRAFTAQDVYASAFNRRALRLNERFQSGELAATVLEVLEGRAMRVLFELSEPLESRYVLLVQTSRGLVPTGFPPVGQSRILPAAGLPTRFLNAP
jgi:hypothetical protein